MSGSAARSLRATWQFFSVIAAVTAFVFASASSANAETTSADATRAPADDAQDIILLSPTHPVRMRLHIQVNGAPFREARRAAIDSAFERLDPKKTGKLSELQANQIFVLFGARANTQPGKSTLAKAGEMMMSASRQYTREEIQSQIAASAPQFKVDARLASGGAGPALFTLLDKDGDGRLSAAELKSAEQSLRCRDFNDDGLLTPEELLQGPGRSAEEESTGLAQTSGAVIVIDPTTPAEKTVEALLFRYDRNRDGRLTLSGANVELRSPGEQFSRLDRNADQVLDRAELTEWLQSEPNIQLAFPFGPRAAAARTTRVAESEGALLYRVRPKLDGGYRLTIAENDLDFRRNNRDPANPNQQQQLRFSSYDSDGNGELSAEELKNAGLVERFAELGFDINDKAADKLTEDKFDELLRRQAAATSSRLTLEVSEEGQDLFTVLDKNGDGFLTAREIKSASEILKTDDANRDGYLSGDEITYHMRLELARDSTNAPAVAASARAKAARVKPVEAAGGGPEWFTKMDRNGDSQISPAEFLGSQAQFDKLDSNHDGLLEAAEATTASKH
jgi:Ca2+-binding EF-hand superfamily protein